ncbi:hypothetical protein [Desulfoluna spongiiphila]|uniref:Uncharacterized protein n=1 Tax=Desulfoluna spongiiphila TaxID=419481 RepID=A0A1G5AF67_9BACT|nr:hypothetical protein [Desulfoluna spongiiphila]SCX76487.1 hypothetical protein SAMN05216233_101125 [Desulfoluna spongiiphila]VVS90648.1 consensus disorder prediction [Desulfoluna spongiiphila]
MKKRQGMNVHGVATFSRKEDKVDEQASPLAGQPQGDARLKEVEPERVYGTIPQKRSFGGKVSHC